MIFSPKADEIVLNIGLNQRTSENEKKRKRQKKRTFNCATWEHTSVSYGLIFLKEQSYDSKWSLNGTFLLSVGT